MCILGLAIEECCIDGLPVVCVFAARRLYVRLEQLDHHQDGWLSVWRDLAQGASSLLMPSASLVAHQLTYTELISSVEGRGSLFLLHW